MQNLKHLQNSGQLYRRFVLALSFGWHLFCEVALDGLL
jgi:hypothetical protein